MIIDLNKELFESYYDEYIDDEITKLVRGYFLVEGNLDKLIKLNDEYNIPPAMAFILLNPNDDLYNNYFNSSEKSESNRQYFGELFGAVFRSLGRKPEHYHKIYLHSASVFPKE